MTATTAATSAPPTVGDYLIVQVDTQSSGPGLSYFRVVRVNRATVTLRDESGHDTRTPLDDVARLQRVAAGEWHPDIRLDGLTVDQHITADRLLRAARLLAEADIVHVPGCPGCKTCLSRRRKAAQSRAVASPEAERAARASVTAEEKGSRWTLSEAQPATRRKVAASSGDPR